MANSQDIKRKISGVKSTAKITKAMQLVSAVKMKKMQENFAGSNEYLNALRQILAHVNHDTELNHELMQVRPNESKVLILLVGNTRGFVGAQLSKLASSFYKLTDDLKKKDTEFDIATVKRKTLSIVKRFGFKSEYHFDESFEKLNQSALLPLRSIIIDNFVSGKYDAVYIVYTEFISKSIQEPRVLKFLPFSIDLDIKAEVKPYKFEPSAAAILNKLIEEYVEISLINIMFSSSASEYSARMVSMKQATDNANEITHELTLEYNKNRQSAITQQIQEITNAQFT